MKVLPPVPGSSPVRGCPARGESLREGKIRRLGSLLKIHGRHSARSPEFVGYLLRKVGLDER